MIAIVSGLGAVLWRERRWSRSRLSLVLLGLALCGSLSATDALAQPEASHLVRGTVVDARSKQPIANAEIRFSQPALTVLSDGRGRFRVDALPPGIYGVIIQRLGYEPLAEVWQVGASDEVLAIELEPVPMLLEGLTVTARRFENRSKASGASVRAIDRRELALSPAADVQQLVMTRANIRPTPCSPLRGRGGATDCYLVRGAASPVLVCIDDTRALGGMEDLMLYKPSDLERMEIYSGGAEIRVYTTWFMERAISRQYRPMPRVPGVCA